MCGLSKLLINPPQGAGISEEPVVPGRKLRVLVVDEEIPYPPDAGKRIRTWNLLRRLACRHSVHLLCYGQESDPSVGALKSAGIAVHLVRSSQDREGPALYARLFINLFSPYPFSVTKHYSSRYQKAYDELIKGSHWDLIQCEWTPYARFVMRSKNVPIVIVAHNVESQIWLRRALHGRNFAQKIFFRLQAWKMDSFERRAMENAHAVTAVTELDAQVMRQWANESVTVVPNGVDLKSYNEAYELERENEILSVASLDWFPNVDAIEYFVNEILPLVQRNHPTAVLRVVGRRPAGSLKERLSKVPGVDFVGEVADVRPYLDRASVIVVPLRIGGGSRLKILEALAAGKAVVSTSIGAEGLGLTSGREMRIADSSDDFASQVSELLASKETRRRLGAAGRKRVVEQYGWDGISRVLEGVWQKVAQNSGAKMAAPAPGQEIQANQ